MVCELFLSHLTRNWIRWQALKIPACGPVKESSTSEPLALLTFLYLIFSSSSSGVAAQSWKHKHTGLKLMAMCHAGELILACPGRTRHLSVGAWRQNPFDRLWPHKSLHRPSRNKGNANFGVLRKPIALLTWTWEPNPRSLLIWGIDFSVWAQC